MPITANQVREERPMNPEIVRIKRAIRKNERRIKNGKPVTGKDGITYEGRLLRLKARLQELGAAS